MTICDELQHLQQMADNSCNSNSVIASYTADEKCGDTATIDVDDNHCSKFEPSECKTLNQLDSSKNSNYSTLHGNEEN